MDEVRSGVLGTIVRSVARGDVVATETHYAAESLLCEHRHERAYISVLLGGTYTEVSERETRLCHGVTAIFHPAGEVHADHFGEMGRCVNIELASSARARLGELGFPIEERLVLADTAAQCALRFLYATDVHSGACVDDLLIEIAAAVRKPMCDTPAPRWFVAAVHESGDALSESLSIASIADHNGVHPTHLAREFRRRLGCSPIEYRRRVRLESAAGALRGTKFSVADIAQAAGFADQSHLARTFHLWSGMSPSTYRVRFGTRPANEML
jgi:AraC family transcriptional regulator